VPYEPLSEKQALDRIDELRDMDERGLFYDETGHVCARRCADPDEMQKIRRGLKRHWSRESR
jgi:hypothetical protein